MHGKLADAAIDDIVANEGEGRSAVMDESYKYWPFVSRLESPRVLWG